MKIRNLFVTVGTGKFDELVKSIDEAAPLLNCKVIIQIGNGEYIPKNCKYFRLAPNLDKYYKKADLIVSHGGAGTIYELLAKGKKVVALANLNRTDVHQYEILKVLSEENYLIWCPSPERIKECVEVASRFKFVRYKKPNCTIADRISKFIEDNS